jgi:hypothetical protein
MARNNQRAAPIAWIAAVLLPVACGPGSNAGGSPAVVFPPAGVARFVIAPPEDGPAWLSGTAFHLVFEGPGPAFGLVEPELFAELVPLGAGEVTTADGRVLGPVAPYSGWRCEPCPEGVPLLAFKRIELAPVDTDRDGIADRLSGAFTVGASFADGEFLHRAEPFVARAEAEIVPASLGSPRLLVPPWSMRDAAAPDEEQLLLSFELPSRVESARFVTSSGDVPVTVVGSERSVWVRPEGLLPWGETITLAGEARVLGTGAPLEPFAIDLPMLPRPADQWSPSFEAEDLAGLAVTHGTVTSADGSLGLPALDGERFLLVESEWFGLVFEVDVPDTDAPKLRFESRLAYRGDGRGLVPYFDLYATGAADRVGALAAGACGEEIPLEGGAFRTASATATAELPLATFRGSRAIVRISGHVEALSETSPAAALQLDGLRVVP